MDRTISNATAIPQGGVDFGFYGGPLNFLSGNLCHSILQPDF